MLVPPTILGCIRQVGSVKPLLPLTCDSHNFIRTETLPTCIVKMVHLRPKDRSKLFSLVEKNTQSFLVSTGLSVEYHP